MEMFIQRCNEWAETSRDYAIKYEDEDNPFIMPMHKASEIGGREFKDWLNTNWNKQDRQKVIKELFANHGLGIYIDEKGYKTIYVKDED